MITHPPPAGMLQGVTRLAGLWTAFLVGLLALALAGCSPAPNDTQVVVPWYIAAMSTHPIACYLAPVTVAVALILNAAACKDEPMMEDPPEPHTQQLGQMCEQSKPASEELCDYGLECQGLGTLCELGFCTPACDADHPCPTEDGKMAVCHSLQCKWPCESDTDCPTTFEMPLYCWSGVYCAADVPQSECGELHPSPTSG